MSTTLDPKISFNAAFMAGYNNPEIAVLTLVIDRSDTPLNYPSFADISALLRSGRVPLLLLTDASREVGTPMLLAEYSTHPGIIRFSSASALTPTRGMVTTITFHPSDPPVITHFPLTQATGT